MRIDVLTLFPDIFDNQITLLEWPAILKIKNLSRNVSIEIKETKDTKDARVMKIEFFGSNPWIKI